MKLMKRRILQVCLTCHWASEKIVIGRRNNMLVRINFYFFLPNSSFNVMFARASVGTATRQRAADPPLPLPQLPAGQQWRLLLRPHHRQPRVLRLQAGLTRLQLHLSLGIAQAQARGEGREAGKDQGDHRLHLRLRHHQPSHGWGDIFFLLQIYNLVFIIQRNSQRLWTDTSWKEWPRSRSPLQKTSGKNQTLLSYIVNSNVPIYRRRGKNKNAAQNCRKRANDRLDTLKTGEELLCRYV